MSPLFKLVKAFGLKFVPGGEESTNGAVPRREGRHTGGHADPERTATSRGASAVDETCLPGMPQGAHSG